MVFYLISTTLLGNNENIPQTYDLIKNTILTNGNANGQ